MSGGKRFSASHPLRNGVFLSMTITKVPPSHMYCGKGAKFSTQRIFCGNEQNRFMSVVSLLSLLQFKV